MIKPKKSPQKSVLDLLKVSAKSVRFSFSVLPFFTLLALVFAIFGYVFDFVRSYFDSRIIDSLISSVSIKQITPELLFWFFMLIVGYVVSSFINQLNKTSAVIYYGRFDKIATMLLTKKLSSLDISYFEDSKSNKLIQKVQQNNYKLRNYLYNIVDLIGISMSLVLAAVIVIKVSPYIFFILLLSYLPYAFSEFKFGRSMWSIWGSKGETKMHASAISDYLTSEHAIPEVRVFGIKDYLLKLYNNFYSIFLEEQLAVEKKKTIYRTLFDILGTSGFAFAYFTIIQKTVSGDFSIGTATFYIASINRMWNSVFRMFGGLSKMLEDNLYIKDYFDLLELPNTIVGGGETIKDFDKIDIEFKNVWFKYPGSKKYIFKDFSFKLKPCERIAIVGENGAGKTTLTKLLLRFYDVSRGEILINGIDIKQYNLNEYYKIFALLSQDFGRYHFDAKTNIALGDIDKLGDLPSIMKSAKLSGASLVINKFENKYEQILSKHFEGGTEPSVGQWQKIALARAFFKNSPVLILDEPTSAIDPKAEYNIFEKLFDFAKNKSVLIISHRFSTVRNADKIIVLDGGKVIEEGSHKELLEKNGIYKEAYDLQKKGYQDV